MPYRSGGQLASAASEPNSFLAQMLLAASQLLVGSKSNSAQNLALVQCFCSAKEAYLEKRRAVRTPKLGNKGDRG